MYSVYDVSKHPKYLNGEWTRDRVFAEFLKKFDSPDNPDGVVSWASHLSLEVDLKQRYLFIFY